MESFEIHRSVRQNFDFSLCISVDELTVYKVQNLQWTADFSGDVTLTWMRPKKMPSASCVYNVYYRWVPIQPQSWSTWDGCPVSSPVLYTESSSVAGFCISVTPHTPPLCDTVFLALARVVGESIWKTLETHSNKTSTVLKVLKPDTTYHVKVQVHCLSKVHNTNDFVTLRTPEGCKYGS